MPFVYDELVSHASATSTPPSNIAVERITGPILLVCGRQDGVWPSCPWTDAITARLTAHHAQNPTTVIKAAGAGHLVGNLLAYVPDTHTSGTTPARPPTSPAAPPPPTPPAAAPAGPLSYPCSATPRADRERRSPPPVHAKG